ncbi:MAG: septal ring lytic transglycosylase RlpA family protein [Sterolibacterium sp.]|nr:septal ring lytic transglycosylase RlpA family protein [Sterolibacterium sp.]
MTPTPPNPLSRGGARLLAALDCHGERCGCCGAGCAVGACRLASGSPAARLPGWRSWSTPPNPLSRGQVDSPLPASPRGGSRLLAALGCHGERCGCCGAGCAVGACRLASGNPAARARARLPSLYLALLVSATTLLLAACGSPASRPAASATPPPSGQAVPPAVKPPKRGGGYYLDDGPGDNPPSDEALAAIPDAVPRTEPLHRFANRPYVVFNREYRPLTAIAPYKAQGIGSWYGRKFHGQRTSSGEIYDMFGMTAAHTTLPIPSYARVTNPANGHSVIVRVNDRGPFHADRLIDLSYAAAWKLGYIGSGSTRLEVESVLPGTPLPPAAPVAPASVDPLAEMIRRTAQNPTLPPPQTTGLLPEVSESRGIFLQLGAFSNADNAENLKNHLARELASLSATPSGNDDLASKLVIQPRAGIYRLQLGPWPDRASAQKIAERLRQAFDIKPLLVQQ